MLFNNADFPHVGNIVTSIIDQRIFLFNNPHATISIQIGGEFNCTKIFKNIYAKLHEKSNKHYSYNLNHVIHDFSFNYSVLSNKNNNLN